MRAMVVHPGPSFSVSDLHVGWVEGLLKMGVEVRSFALDDRLAVYSSAERKNADGSYVPMFDEAGSCQMASQGILSGCFAWWPEFVLIVSCFYIPLQVLDMIRGRGIKVILLHTESPYEDQRQIARAAHADLNLLNDPTNLDSFAEVAPSAYMPHAYRPSVHCPGPASPDLESDFAFVGTGYRSRIDFLEAVDWTGIDVALAGNWQETDEGSPLRPFIVHAEDECMDNADTVDMYRSTKASANLYRREAERPELSAGWAMGPREVELAACGTFYLTQPRGENRTMLPMVPTFETPDEFQEKLRWFLAREGQRRDIAERAREAIAERTFASNARSMLRLLDGLTRKGSLCGSSTR